MAVVILNAPYRKRVLVVCVSYSEAIEWSSAHNDCYQDTDGCIYPLTVEDRTYSY